MSLRTEIEANYTDVNWLVCNRRCKPTDINPSGNGVCYTGEYVTLLSKRKELLTGTCGDYFHAMMHCMVKPGLLARGPGNTDAESVDDYYGFAAGCVATGHEELVQMVIRYGWAHFGSFNNTNPGKWTFASWLWRQPQLVFSLYCAAGYRARWYNPTTWWLYCINIYTALVIATSCMFASNTDWDSRRLAWLLIQTTAPVSRLCRWAAETWYGRLFKTYPNGMKDICAGYYESGHPFIEYSVTR